jgi:hypothetical protein
MHKKSNRAARSGRTRLTDMMLQNGDKRQCFAVKNSLFDSGSIPRYCQHLLLPGRERVVFQITELTSPAAVVKHGI